jgi:PEP-CTERM motif-containing protein
MMFRRTLLAAVASVSFAGLANAAAVTGQISLGGFVQAVGATSIQNATGLNFANANGTGNAVGTNGTLAFFGAGTGSFASLGSCANSTGCGSISDIVNLATQGAMSNFLTLNTGSGGPTVAFDLGSITLVDRSSSPYLDVTATGTIRFTGFDATPGTFFFSAQGDQIVSFSATTLAAGINTPEPASLAILGGSLAALGLVRRRRRARAESP